MKTLLKIVSFSILTLFAFNLKSSAQCNSFEFYRKFSNGERNRLEKLIALSDGGSLAVGSIGDVNFPDGLMMKITRDGNIVWANRLGATGIADRIIDGIETSDGGFMLIGQTNLASGNRSFLAKLNASGSLQWTKNYPTYSYNISHPAKVIELTNGGYAVAAIQTAGIQTGFVMRTDVSGNVVWAKNYTTGAGFTTNANDLVEIGNELVVTGFCETFSGTINHYRYLMGLQIADGAIGWQKRWPNANADFFRTMGKAGDKIILSFFNNNERIFTVTGSNPSSLQASRHPIPAISSLSADFAATADTGIVHAEIGPSSNSIRLIKMKDNALVSVKGIQLATGDAASAQVTDESVNGELLAAFTVTDPTSSFHDIGFISTQNSYYPNISCNLPVPAYNLDPRTIATENFTWPIFSNQTISAAVQAYNFSAVNFTNQLICSSTIDPCILLDVPMADTVCLSTTATRFIATRAAGCQQAVQFQIDPAFAQVLASTDTTIDLQFLQQGTVKLFASMATPCGILKDSVQILVSRHADSLNLGANISFCGQAQFNLSGGSGYSTYLWQDGSTNPTLIANSAGIYHLTVVDYCGNSYRDSVVITSTAPPAIDLGPDKFICPGDTITLNGPAGFNQYNWSPNSHIINPNGQNVDVFPAAATKYYLHAESSPGCISIDSIIVNVHPLTPIALPADASICEGNSISLQAPSGFNSYSWNTGATSSSIQVTSVGLYTVSTTDANGCISRDSFRLVSLYPKPTVNLGIDTAICASENKVLDAGAGSGWQYLWQNGSNTQTITISDTGRYHVRVTDMNGCIGTDTLHVRSKISSPQNFLPADISICFPSQYSISSTGNFSNYQWSTGSTANSILVSQPGVYALEVVNDQGCTGIDSIVVSPKVCSSKMFFPNAFTPDADGVNDHFKGLHFGSLVLYELTIYNRWGQTVFSTKDISRGWDGTVFGQKYGNVSFTWFCRYQFTGSPIEQQKGTVILIK